MIGDEDAAAMRNYTTSVRCVSQSGILLAIKTSDFYQRIKVNDETWKYIIKTAKEKEY